MNDVYPWFATIALVLSVSQVLFGFWRWTRIATFRVVAAGFRITGDTPGAEYVASYTVSVIARGGSRSTRIVDWKLVFGPLDESGKVRGLGGINTLQPIDQLIPANDVAKFTLSYTPGGGTMVRDADLLEARLILDFGRDDDDQEIVTFRLRRSGDVFLLDDFPTIRLWEPRQRWRRLWRAVRKRLA